MKVYHDNPYGPFGGRVFCDNCQSTIHSGEFLMHCAKCGEDYCKKCTGEMIAKAKAEIEAKEAKEEK